jgi:O-antigen ligase
VNPGILLTDGVFIGLFCGGLRAPWLWSAAAALSWLLIALLPPRTSAAPLLPWGAWLAWAALSAGLSPEPLLSLAAFCKLAAPFAVFLLALGRADDSVSRAWLLRLALAAPILSLSAAYAFRPGYPGTGLLPPYYNYTACVLACAYGATLSASLQRELVRAERLALAGSAMIALCSIAAVRSRGALFSCGLVTFILLWRRQECRKILLSALAAAVIPAVFFLNSHFGAAFLKSDLPSASVRPKIWACALAVAKDHPIFGTGPGRFERGFLQHRFPAPPAYAERYGLSTAYAHSEPLQAAAETGFLGAFLLAMAIGSALWRSLSTLPPPDFKARSFREPALAACAAMLVQSFFDNVFALPGIAFLFALTLAAALPSEAEGPAARPAASRFWRPAAVFLAAASALAWWPSWALSAHSERTALPGARGVEAALSALELAPKNDYLWGLLSRTLLRDAPRTNALALRAAREAGRLSPTDATHALLEADILRMQEDWKGSLAAASRAAALEPGCVQAHLLRAQALLRGASPAQAREALSQARRAAALSGPIRGNSPVGYAGRILEFDAALLEELSRATMVPGVN